MTLDEFTHALVAEMEADESTAFVDALLKDARALIRKGKGTVGTLTSSSLNGKSFQRQVQFTAVQVLSACRRALKLYLGDGEGDDEVSATYPNFSEITR